MDPFTNVITDYLTAERREGRVPTLKDFVNAKTDYIAAHSIKGEDFSRDWGRRFGQIAKTLQIEVAPSIPDWFKVALIMLSQSPASPAVSSAPSSSSSVTSSAVSTPTSTNTQSTTPLSQSAKKYVKSMFDGLDEEKMWRLGSGKKVEQVMKTLALQCKYEHPSHSLILDITDKQYTTVLNEAASDEPLLSPADIREIKQKSHITLPELPPDVDEHLKSYLGIHTLDEFFVHRSMFAFHPKRQADLHWIHQSFIRVLDLFHYHHLPLTDQTEGDIMRRVWGFIETCFDESIVVVRCGEKLSTASSKRMNAKRQIDGIDSMSRKRLGHKVDMLFSCLMHEYGCTEASLCTEDNATKPLREGSIKLPKILKDMFFEIVSEKPAQLRNVKTIGFLINGLHFSPLILDCPDGFVCRLSRTNTLEFPSCVEELAAKMVPLLTIVWKLKQSMKESIASVQMDTTVRYASFNDEDQAPIPRSMPSPKRQKK